MVVLAMTEKQRRPARRKKGTGPMTSSSRAAQGCKYAQNPRRKVTMPKRMLGQTGCKQARRDKLQRKVNWFRGYFDE